MTLPTHAVKVFAPGAALGATPKATLTAYFDDSFEEDLNETGAASLSLEMSDPQLSSIDHLDWLRWYVDGSLVFTSVVERIRRGVVDPAEERGQKAVITGKGLGSILGRAAFIESAWGAGRHRVPDARLWNGASRYLDDSGWLTGPFAVSQVNTSGPWGDAPKGLPTEAASAYWMSSLAGGGDGVGGSEWFRRSFTLDKAYKLAVFTTLDNGGVVWIDEWPILTEPSAPDASVWNDIRRIDIDLDGGDHNITVRVDNFTPFVGANPAACVVAILKLDEGGDTFGSVVLVSDGSANWRYLVRPAAEPTMTPGEIMIAALTEAQARGTIPEVSWDFTASNDSNGDPWAKRTSMSVPMGANYLTLLAQLAETCCDWYVTDDGTCRLSMVNSRGDDLTGSVTLAAGTNLTKLEVDESVEQLTNVLGIRSGEGFDIVEHSGSISGFGRFENFLSAGAQDSVEQTSALASAVFTAHSSEEIATTAEIHPGINPVGWRDFAVGDTVTVAGTPDRVVGLIGTRLPDNGVFVTTPRITGLREPAEVRLAQAVRRMAPGTIGGTVASVSPPLPPPAFSDKLRFPKDSGGGAGKWAFFEGSATGSAITYDGTSAEGWSGAGVFEQWTVTIPTWSQSDGDVVFVSPTLFGNAMELDFLIVALQIAAGLPTNVQLYFQNSRGSKHAGVWSPGSDITYTAHDPFFFNIHDPTIFGREVRIEIAQPAGSSALGASALTLVAGSGYATVYKFGP